MLVEDFKMMNEEINLIFELVNINKHKKTIYKYKCSWRRKEKKKDIFFEFDYFFCTLL